MLPDMRDVVDDHAVHAAEIKDGELPVLKLNLGMEAGDALVLDDNVVAALATDIDLCLLDAIDLMATLWQANGEPRGRQRLHGRRELRWDGGTHASHSTDVAVIGRA